MTALPLKDRLLRDLERAECSGDHARVGALRGVISALPRYGASSDDVVGAVLAREAKRRAAAAAMWRASGHSKLAEREQDAGLVLADYLPAGVSIDDAESWLSSEELAALVSQAVDQVDRSDAQVDAVMATVRPRVRGRAELGAVLAEIRRQLA